jgi:hypothetical protein
MNTRQGEPQSRSENAKEKNNFSYRKSNPGAPSTQPDSCTNKLPWILHELWWLFNPQRTVMGQSPKLGRSQWKRRQCRVPFESLDRSFVYRAVIKLYLVSSSFVFSCAGRSLMTGRMLAQGILPVFCKPVQKNRKARALCRLDGSAIHTDIN